MRYGPKEEKTSFSNKEKKEKSGRRHIRNLLIKIAAVALIFIFVIGLYRVDGTGMYPNLKDGDLVFIYRPVRPSAGDVVVYKAGGKTRIGRVAAVAEETFDITDENEVTVNGSVESGEIFYPTAKDGIALPLPYKTGDGEVIILNDYRSDTNDSRTFGAVSVSDIKGKVILLHRRRGF